MSPGSLAWHEVKIFFACPLLHTPGFCHPIFAIICFVPELPVAASASQVTFLAGKVFNTTTMLSKLFGPGNDSVPTSIGLLVLRLWLGLTLLLNHGIAKLKGFDSMASGFADPLKIGHTPSLALVVFAEVVAALLLAAGLITRFAALVLMIEMGVAFFLIHQRSFSGSHSGELAFIYLAGFAALFLAGPGRVSLDKKFFGGGGRGSSSKKSKSSER